MPLFSFDNFRRSKAIALLIDPDKDSLSDEFLFQIQESNPDFIFIGGTQPFSYVRLDEIVVKLKRHLQIPIIGFPGSKDQVHSSFDALLALSVIQSHDVTYIFKQLIDSAKRLNSLNFKTYFTPYFILNHEGLTSVEILLKDKIEQINTIERFTDYLYAIKIINCSCIYLEAGSGSNHPVNQEWIKCVSQILPDIFLIVGGGIDTVEKAEHAWNSGANCVVLGNTIEKNPELLIDFCKSR